MLSIYCRLIIIILIYVQLTLTLAKVCSHSRLITNGIGQTFQIVSPNLEGFKNGKQFLVIYVIIQLCYSKSARIKGNWMNFIISVNNRENCSESIVRGISFYNELSIGNPMSEDRCRGECFLERVESIFTGGVKLPRSVLPGKTYQWNDNVWVVEDELAVKVCET